jgi:hypothetical protein
VIHFSYFVYKESMPLHVSGFTRPSSGGSAKLLCGVIACVECVFTACRLGFHRKQHAVNTRSTHAITPHNNFAEPPEDGRVKPETCRGIDS